MIVFRMAVSFLEQRKDGICVARNSSVDISIDRSAPKPKRKKSKVLAEGLPAEEALKMEQRAGVPMDRLLERVKCDRHRGVSAWAVPKKRTSLGFLGWLGVAKDFIFVTEAAKNLWRRLQELFS